jgi:CheY-like chemotaxis protein
VSDQRHILVVEDDRDLREAICEALEQRGFHTGQAAHGRDALQQLESGPRPNLILLDLMMPTMNGWEFRSEQLKSPDLSSIPVLIMSAYKSSGAANIQAAGFITKPVTLKTLIDSVENCIGS